MSFLAESSLQNMMLPLPLLQQLADLRYLQGLFDAGLPRSEDLLAGMAVKSRSAAVAAMSATNGPKFDYKSGLTYLQGPANKEPLEIELIQRCHRQLHPQGGVWRAIKLKLPRRDKDSEYLHIPCGALGVEPAINSLLQDWHRARANNVEPLLAIPLFLLELLRIFPFFDGNRRIALLIARHLLQLEGHTVINYVDLESEINATERAFYRALHKATDVQQADPRPWLIYWLVLLKRLYQRFDRQLQHANINPGRGAKSALIEHFVRQRSGDFRFSDVCDAFPTISHDMVRVALRRLRDQDIIQARGRGPGAVWIKI